MAQAKERSEEFSIPKSQTIEKITDDIRDMINWIAVFEEEYNLPGEVVNKLRERLEDIAARMGDI